MVLPYNNINMATAWENSYFNLSELSDFYIESQWVAVQPFSMHILILLLVDETVDSYL